MALLPTAIPVTEKSQVGQVRRAAMQLARAPAFSDETRGEIAIVATELATNLARYGREGRFFLQSIGLDQTPSLQMLAVDAGPGIADLQRSLQDGVSTGGTPGTGLGAVRRLSHDFDVYSVPGQGTVVLSEIGAGAKRKRQVKTFQWAALSTPAPGESVCGDSWRVLENEDQLAVMVADGLGHGPLAAEAAERAAAIFTTAPFTEPMLFCDRAHKSLSGTRGAALALAQLFTSGRLSYAGVGNISGTLVAGDKSRGLSSQNGTAGVAVRKVQQFDYDLPERGVLVMHSDGLTNRWSLGSYQGLAARHPAVIAAVLYRDCLRGKDDATVVVVKRMAQR